MHVLMVTDAYPPMRTSCAVQMYYLAQAFIEEGHQVTVITPDSTPKEHIRITQQDGVRLVQVKAFETKDINYVSRTLAEFINPFLIWHKLKKSSEFINTQYDGIIWYSPTIFWGPLIRRLKMYFSCSSYLILRDFFPDWAVDLGVIKKGLAYYFFKAVEKYQYQQANRIGVQSPNNLVYFNAYHPQQKLKAEVLWNWISPIRQSISSIDLRRTTLDGRTILVYAGNMGVAQGIDALFDMVVALRDREDVGFVFIGRGSEVSRLKEFSKKQCLSNILFFDEISPSEIESLFESCHIGLLSLDLRHSSHNIPGKFLAYMNSSLPVFGFVNSGNDLLEIVQTRKIGVLISKPQLDQASDQLKALIDQIGVDKEMPQRCKALANELFSATQAVKKIESHLRV